MGVAPPKIDGNTICIGMIHDCSDETEDAQRREPFYAIKPFLSRRSQMQNGFIRIAQ